MSKIEEIVAEVEAASGLARDLGLSVEIKKHQDSLKAMDILVDAINELTKAVKELDPMNRLI